MAFHELLTSTAVGFVSTLGKRGEPRIALVVVDPVHPTHYIELRGTVSDLVIDPDFALERAIAKKYVREWTDVEPPGTPRYATSMVIEKTTMQQGAPTGLASRDPQCYRSVGRWCITRLGQAALLSFKNQWPCFEVLVARGVAREAGVCELYSGSTVAVRREGDRDNGLGALSASLAGDPCQLDETIRLQSQEPAVVRVPRTLELGLEVEGCVHLRSHEHRVGCSEPKIELLRPCPEQRARGYRHRALDGQSLGSSRQIRRANNTRHYIPPWLYF